MAQKYYIEFVGVNGSGKTTLANKLNAHLREQGWTLLELPRSPKGTRRQSKPIYRFRKMLKYYSAHPVCFAECLYVRWYPGFRYRGSLHTLIKRKYKTEKHFRKKFDAIINHEGTFQFYRAAGHHIGSVDRVPGYHAIFRAKQLGYKTLIINLNVDADAALKRCGTIRPSVQEPSEWSLASESPERQNVLMDEWVAKKDNIVELLRQRGIRVLDVDTGLSLEQSYAQMLDQLEDFLVFGSS